MARLTKIEVLDAEHPGLEDDVCRWLTQGMTAAQVAGRLLEERRLPNLNSAVSAYRKKRWVPMRRRIQKQKEARIVDLELAQELAVRRSLSAAPEGGRE